MGNALGAQGEAVAWAELALRGYRLVDRNHRCPRGEVDIIAWDGEILCFIEVRSRSNLEFGDPLESIDRRKMLRVAHGARDFLSSWSGTLPEMRFDVVGVVFGDSPSVTLIQDAFQL